MHEYQNLISRNECWYKLWSMYYFWTEILDSYSESGVQILVYGPVILNEMFVVLLSISSSPRHLPFTSSPIYYWVILVTRVFMVCAAPQYTVFGWSNWQRHVARMGDGRDAYRTLVVGGTWRKEAVLQDLGLDGRITLQWILTKWDGGMDWIGLAQHRNSWRAFVDAVMSLRVL